MQSYRKNEEEYGNNNKFNFNNCTTKFAHKCDTKWSREFEGPLFVGYAWLKNCFLDHFVVPYTWEWLFSHDQSIQKEKLILEMESILNMKWQLTTSKATDHINCSKFPLGNISIGLLHWGLKLKHESFSIVAKIKKLSFCPCSPMKTRHLQTERFIHYRCFILPLSSIY